jgi:hypothetical protein
MKQLLMALAILSCMIGTASADDADSAPFFNANKAAFVTATSLAVLTAASAIGAATAANTASTFALVSYSALAVTSGAVSIAAITAWLSLKGDKSTIDAGSYFQKVGEHAAIAVAGTYQFVSQILVLSIVQGVAQGISRSIFRSIAGEDQRIRIIR